MSFKPRFTFNHSLPPVETTVKTVSFTFQINEQNIVIELTFPTPISTSNLPTSTINVQSNLNEPFKFYELNIETDINAKETQK